MTNLTLSFEQAQELYYSTEDFPVDFEEAGQWLGYSRKDVAKRNFENSGFIEGVDFQVFHTSAENSNGGRPIITMKLTCECFKQWGMLSGTPKGKEVRMYFLQCEKVAKETLVAPKPQSTGDMLLMFAQAFKEHEERLSAVELENTALKHQLEAVEMESSANTVELERFRNGHGYWYSIVGWCNRNGIKKDIKWMSGQGKKASALCRAKGILPVPVSDARYGNVNTYPDSVLAELVW